MNEGTPCSIEAHGVVRTPWCELATLRDDPGMAALAPHLRMSDDQTLLATTAVMRAIASAGWQSRSFHDWGVIAAPRYLGRQRIAVTCARFRKHNIRGYSPLIIPHQSLHAVAGTLSIALKIHGPNFGIGGGPDHVGEALLTGLSLVRSGKAQGWWVVVTDFDPEPTPTATGETSTPTVGHAVALALTADSANAGAFLDLQPQSTPPESSPLRVCDLVDFLLSNNASAWYAAVDGIGMLTCQKRRSGQSLAA